jgi:hypothetical protein
VSRRSYRGLMALPAWGLYEADGALVATIRAPGAPEAADLFEAHGFERGAGRRVRLVLTR